MKLKISLTDRQKKAALLISAGCSRKGVAEGMKISVRTVADYLEKLRWKTNTASTGELIAFLNRNPKVFK